MSINCRICLSPHRRELEVLLKDTPVSLVVKRYLPVFGCTAYQLNASIRRHTKNHGVQPSVVINHSSEVGKPDLDGFAQKLLDIASIQILEDPSKVKIKDALSAQKLLIEKQKVKIGETALMLSMAKLFGGFEGKTPALEGEEVKVIDGTIAGNTE